MPKKTCGFGFDCGLLLAQPGLEPPDCPNYSNCAKAARLTPDQEIELVRVSQEQPVEVEQRARHKQVLRPAILSMGI